MRVVLDTNIIVSAILFGGKPKEILDAALFGDFQLQISEPMIAELQGVLQRPKFGLSLKFTQSIVSEITMLAEWVTPQRHFDLIANDPADNFIIECAIEAEADFIVSGDRHLLTLGRCGKTEIMNPDSFLMKLGKKPRYR
jgi:putative PIN family toxin of toxin-antitoxin system